MLLFVAAPIQDEQSKSKENLRAPEPKMTLNQRVIGSNPIAPTNLFNKLHLFLNIYFLASNQ